MKVRLHEHPLGLTWVVREPMNRASHALADGGRVWLVEPVDAPDALEAALSLGEPAAVLQLLDRHNRDGAAIAARLGVPLLRIPAALPGTPFDVVRVVRVPRWQEVALWWPQRRALVVSDVVGTGAYYTVSGGAAGMHPFARLTPPGSLRAYQPEHLLVGHGRPLHGPDASAGLREAYRRARRDLPRFVAALPRLGRAARAADAK